MNKMAEDVCKHTNLTILVLGVSNFDETEESLVERVHRVQKSGGLLLDGVQS